MGHTSWVFFCDGGGGGGHCRPIQINTFNTFYQFLRKKGMNQFSFICLDMIKILKIDFQNNKIAERVYSNSDIKRKSLFDTLFFFLQIKNC